MKDPWRRENEQRGRDREMEMGPVEKERGREMAKTYKLSLIHI